LRGYFVAVIFADVRKQRHLPIAFIAFRAVCCVKALYGHHSQEIAGKHNLLFLKDLFGVRYRGFFKSGKVGFC
jgi:hypothetical protein